MLTISICIAFVFLMLAITAIIETILDKIQLRARKLELEKYDIKEEGE